MSHHSLGYELVNDLISILLLHLDIVCVTDGVTIQGKYCRSIKHSRLGNQYSRLSGDKKGAS